MLFLDTEFTDFINCDLISIGLISEDGRYEFYGERTDFNYDWCNDFVRSAVWAHLGEFPESKAKKHQLAERLYIWLGSQPYEIEIACDSLIDWELMIDALDGKIPENVKGYENMCALINKSSFNKALHKYYETTGKPQHHALHDARAFRLGWLAVKNERESS